MRPLLELAEDQRLVGARAIDPGLRRRDAKARGDDRLHIHQPLGRKARKARLGHARRRRDDHASRGAIDRDDRPGGMRHSGHSGEQEKRGDRETEAGENAHVSGRPGVEVMSAMRVEHAPRRVTTFAPRASSSKSRRRTARLPVFRPQRICANSNTSFQLAFRSTARAIPTPTAPPKKRIPSVTDVRTPSVSRDRSVSGNAMER